MIISKDIQQAVMRLLLDRKTIYEEKNQKIRFLTLLFRYGLSRLRNWKNIRNQRIKTEAINLLKAEYVIRTISEFQGLFELNVRSKLTRMILNEGFERDLIAFFNVILHPGQHFVDIGANIGLYTVLTAKLVGDSGIVLAAEPAPNVFRLLTCNIKRNELKNIILFNGVVTSQSGSNSLNFVEDSPEYSSLGAIVHPHAPNNIKQVTVPGETLDNLVRINGLKPSLVKIDVEGAEGLVLSGADAVLKTWRPIILSELDDRLLKELNWDSQKVISLLESYQYKIFDAHNGIEIKTSTIRHPFIGEIICLPVESNG
jgi:FkbM family methyltransferase